MLRNCVVFTDGGAVAQTTDELQRMFKDHGANEVYARIATTRVFNPGNGDHSVLRGLERAVLAKALKLPFIRKSVVESVWRRYLPAVARISATIRN